MIDTKQWLYAAENGDLEKILNVAKKIEKSIGR